MYTQEYGTASIVLDSSIGLGVAHPVALDFNIVSVTYVSPYTIRVRFSLPPNVSDATTSVNYSIPGLTIQKVLAVSTDPNLFVIQLVSPPAAATYTLTVSGGIRPASGSLTLQAPLAVPFIVGLGNATQITGGTTNVQPEDEVSQYFNPAYKKHKNWKDITKAISTGDESVAQIANSVLNQSYLASASGPYLEKRALEYGLKKPDKTWISDDLFRTLAISVINQKLTAKAFLDMLEVFYGPKAVRGCLATALREPYSLFDGGWVQVLVDEKYLVDVVFDKEDFEDIRVASAQELASVVTAAMDIYGYAQVETDPVTKENFVEVYSASKGLGSSLRITQGTAQPVLEFPTNLFPNATAGTIWSVEKLVNDKARYFCNGLAPFNLGLVDTGDYINILDSSFSSGNRGSFVITDTGTGEGVWDFTGSMITPRGDHTATLLNNGKVLIVGGYNGNYLSSSELYDFTTNTFTSTGNLGTLRGGHCATLLNNGKVLITGGNNQTGPLQSAEIYDPALGTFSSTGMMVSPRGQHTATLLNSGKVLLIGGFDSVYLASSELYNPNTGLFSSSGNMAAGRFGHTATLLENGEVLIAGGENLTGILKSAEIYDPALGTFSVTGDMTIDREFHTATRLENGEVLIAGGQDGGYLSSAELYDFSTGFFIATGSMNEVRLGHTALLLQDGSVLVSGGFGSESPNTAEVYQSGFWSLASGLNAPRWNHTATLLSNGEVLVVGGYGNGESPDTAEVLGNYGTYLEVTNPDAVTEVVTILADLGVTIFSPTKYTSYSNPNWVTVAQSNGQSIVSLPVTTQVVSRDYSSAAYLRENDLQPIQSITRDVEGLTTLTTREPHSLMANKWFEILETKPNYQAQPTITPGSPSGPTSSTSISGTSDLTSRSWISVDTTRPSDFARSIRDFNGNLWIVGGFTESRTQENLSVFQATGSIDSTGARQNSYTWNNFSDALIQPLGSALCVLGTPHHYGQVLIAGGIGVANVGTTLILDFSNNIISKTISASIPVETTYASLTYLPAPTSKAALIGGIVGASTVNDIRLFDPEANSYIGTWTSSPYTLITSRYQHKAIQIDTDTILVIGGRTTTTHPDSALGAASNIDAFAMGSVLNTCEKVVLSHGVSAFPSMSWARFAFGMVKLPDNRILIVGGIGYRPNDSSIDPSAYSNRQCELKSVEIYDPVYGTWSTLPDTLEPHSYCTCEYVESENKVFVFGGYKSRLVEYLDLKNMRWKRLPDLMPTIRVFGAGGLVGDDVLILSGGANVLPDTGLTTSSAISLSGSATLGIASYGTNSRGLNGAFKIISAGGQTLTFKSEGEFASTALGNIVSTESVSNPEVNGPFIYDTSGVAPTGVYSTTVTDIGMGVGKDLVQIASTSDFPDEGYVVFNFGLDNQMGPVYYYSKSSDTLNLDPGFRYSKEVPVGSEVRVLSGKSVYVPNSSTNGFHITASSSGRVAAIDLLNEISATGIPLIINTRYPGDIGLGNTGRSTKGVQKISDIVEAYAGDDIDNEVLEARNVG